jgi:D-tyrosyl-tRNA(Tyr) deacylase
MRAVIQRVREARVTVGGETIGSIGGGLLVLLGIHQDDGFGELEWMAAKISQLRIFEDTEGKMNLSIQDTGGEVLVVSQFTLYADCRKGRRPSFVEAAKPDKAIPLYESFCQRLQLEGIRTARGQFGAKMSVSLVNDGPVTITIDTADR